MGRDNSRHSTRDTSSEKDEVSIQTVVEKVLSNNTFIDNLLSAMIDKATVDGLELLDQHGKKNNLCFCGVPENNNENINITITTNCKPKLNVDITENDIACSCRLYTKVGNQRLIIVSFCRNSVKAMIFITLRKNSDSNIVIWEDLTRKRSELVKDIST
ncbi:hypothetical protein FQA39_LY15686 [Lamprigera yunnana]|nr:hypothetical protein FQA39_LY15686 [Lamprigera yunnana]